jgi:hypothetical protein
MKWSQRLTEALPTCSTSQISLGKNDLHIVQYHILKHIPTNMTGNIYIEHVHIEDVGKCSTELKLQGGTQTHVVERSDIY